MTNTPHIDAAERSLIDQLVRERAAADAEEARAFLDWDNIKTVHRSLDPLRTEEIYLFDISVVVGVSNLTIDCGEIELNESVSEAIAEADGRWTITIPVFGELSRKGTQLATRRRKIQKDYLRFARPYWYVSKSDMPQLRDELFKRIETDKPQKQGLLPLAEDLRNEALDVYDQSFTEFLGKVDKIGRRAKLNQDRLEQLLMSAASQFPTRQDILNNFGVFIEGPIRLPSLIEEAERDADLAEAIARQSAARLEQLELQLQEERIEAAVHMQAQEIAQQGRLQRYRHREEERLQKEALESKRKAQEREDQAIRELQQFWIKSVQDSFATGIRKAQDDGYGLIADILSTIEKIHEPGKIHGNLKKRLDSKLRELQTAINAIANVNDGEYDPSLQKFAEKVSQLKVLTASDIAPESLLHRRIQELRSQMTDELTQVFGSSRKGHKALAQWLIHEDDEDTNQEENHVTLQQN